MNNCNKNDQGSVSKIVSAGLKTYNYCSFKSTKTRKSFIDFEDNEDSIAPALKESMQLYGKIKEKNSCRQMLLSELLDDGEGARQRTEPTKFQLTMTYSLPTKPYNKMRREEKPYSPSMNIFYSKNIYSYPFPPIEMKPGPLTDSILTYDSKKFRFNLKGNKSQTKLHPGKLINEQDLQLIERDRRTKQRKTFYQGQDSNNSLNNEEAIKYYFEASSSKCKKHLLSNYKLKEEKKSNYELVGSEERWLEILSTIYAKITNEERMKVHFTKVDVESHMRKMNKFFYQNMGDHTLISMDLTQFHQGMNISNTDFDIFKGIYAISMRQYSVDEDIIGDMSKFIESNRKLIVHKRRLNDILEKSDQTQEAFYATILNLAQNDPIINSVFCNYPEKVQSNHMKRIMTALTSGFPNMESLREYHKKLNINHQHFHAMKSILRQALIEHKVVQTTRDEMLEEIESTREDVLNITSTYNILTRKCSANGLVDLFMVEIRRQPELLDLFSDFNEERLRRHTTIFLNFFLKGPTKYTRSDIIPAHIGVKLGSIHLKAMKRALEGFLKNFPQLPSLTKRYLMVDYEFIENFMMKRKKIFQEFGGQKAINVLVDNTFIKSFQSDLYKYYVNTDPSVMKRHQKAFYKVMFLGKICSYHHSDMRTLHQRLKITKPHFEEFMNYNLDVLKEMNINEELSNTVMTLLKSFEHDIVSE